LSEALGLIELSSIARGVVVADVLCKKAPVNVVRSAPVSPGKFVILMIGGVADVTEAFHAGIDAAAHTLLDRLLLPQAHEQLPAVISREPISAPIDSVGVVETFTVASAVLGADAACKAADITLLEMRLGQHIGGKGYFTFTGTLDSVEAAVDAARRALDGALLCATEIIAAPHEDLRGRRLIWGG
jgi:microcompartment protein CcmL/EutN